MADLNTALITVTGVMATLNTYWMKNWKTSVDKKLDNLDEKLDKHGERIAKIEGRLNGKVVG